VVDGGVLEEVEEGRGLKFSIGAYFVLSDTILTLPGSDDRITSLRTVVHFRFLRQELQSVHQVRFGLSEVIATRRPSLVSKSYTISIARFLG
jgi:hypothetical protein